MSTDMECFCFCRKLHWAPVACLPLCGVIANISGSWLWWEHQSRGSNPTSSILMDLKPTRAVRTVTHWVSMGTDGSAPLTPWQPPLMSFLLCLAGYFRGTNVKTTLNRGLTIMLISSGPCAGSAAWAKIEAISVCGHLSPFSDDRTKCPSLSH